MTLLRAAIIEDKLIKLTLGKPNGSDANLKNIFVRPVTLKTGPHLSFVYRHVTRDITKNHPPESGLKEIDQQLGGQFLDGHLFTADQQVQLECQPDGTARLRIKRTSVPDQPAVENTHDKPRHYTFPADAPWLRALGVTNDRGQPREGMAAKYRQIQKFAELISHLAADAVLPTDRPLRIADMGCGKGYLTFAVAALFGESARVVGIEQRADLVELGNRVAAECGFNTLQFQVGSIGDQAITPLDILIALHACDTATDDALAQGINAGATLLIVSPCCQKELRHQLTAPPVLADALQHGIFQERQAEFVTDALRAQLLNWAGYHTKVFEFISTEHTAKNIMISGCKSPKSGDAQIASRIRAFAAFYGITQHQLATHLKFSLP
ncbi:MAG: SAM-dependent methyltransferase [Cephaloticoccus sp.]|nr:SAM-dependent methyltransferase [Cephaloticoccus sp.]MCF7760257.1 SAM-dependent methyltransferase [Cephaloticoccus sp.]